MKILSRPRIFVALIHYPVSNKNGEKVASAVTNLDLHDIARASRTYGVERFYVVTPLEDQKDLVRQIRSHWVEGGGAAHNPARGQALELIKISHSMEDMVEDIRLKTGEEPLKIITSASKGRGAASFSFVRELLDKGRAVLLVFGTAWGLAGEILEQADHSLEPIMGEAEYNHLSVRSAVSIILDRLVVNNRYN